MKKLLAAVVLVALVGVAGAADDPKAAPDKKEPAEKEKSLPPLKAGDPAPALKATAWLQGEEVRAFEPGQIYVVEFWATWCGPCIMLMPHVSELQAQYKGVKFIAYSARDPNNTEEKVAAFVKKRGPKLKYIFAYADDQTTYDAWMKAAGQDGIPCAFVVDKAGRIAFIGHPLFLSVVLPRVVAGTATVQAISDEVRKMEEEFAAISFRLARDPKAGLKALAEFETKYPQMANNPVFVRPKLSLLPKVGEADEARKVAEGVVAKAIQQGDSSALMQVAALLRNGPGKESKELLAVAMKAAEAAVQVTGDEDAQTLLELAETYFQVGDKAKAKEFARKAVTAAAGESPGFKKYIKQQAQKLDDEKK